MKKVLALCYSQTGQLRRAFDALLAGLDPAEFEVHVEVIRSRENYPFPWGFWQFMDVFPESVNGEAPQIEEPDFDPDANWDLVVIGYTVWYLAPALPIQGFLHSEYARVLKDKPVLTLLACRNMWHGASEQMKRELARLEAHHMDNVVLVDDGPPWATFVTTPRWMFTGKKDQWLGIFPPAGVSPEAIEGCRRFGEAVSRGRDQFSVRPIEPLCRGLGAVEVNERFVIPEMVGLGSFRPWARIVRLFGPRGSSVRLPVLAAFLVYLVLAILVLIPTTIVLRILLFPFLRKPLRAQVRQLRAPSGDEA
ncbi:MAG: hypothetical protein ACI8QS_003177 [Planctomycetota bacterium]|jgi:hypothetical protein